MISIIRDTLSLVVQRKVGMCAWWAETNEAITSRILENLLVWHGTVLQDSNNISSIRVF